MPKLYFIIITSVLLLTSCSSAAPRNESLPPYILIADFSKQKDFLTDISTGYEAIEGDPSASERSTAQISIQDIEGERVLVLDYQLRGKLRHQVYAGITFFFEPAILLRKDWSTIAFEMRASVETGPIELVAIEAMGSEFWMKDYCNIPTDNWILCGAPITELHAGKPNSTEFFTELKVSLQNGVSTPINGSIEIRRVFLLATPNDSVLRFLGESVINKASLSAYSIGNNVNAIPTVSYTKKPLDQHRIVLTSNIEGSFDIYIMDGDGNNSLNLTRDLFDSREPSFSPNGNQIAFVSYSQGEYQIYIINTDGSNLTPITNGSLRNIEYPTWSPNGDSIAFFAIGENEQTDIFTVSLIDSHLSNITNSPESELFFSWSPDGDNIAYMSEGSTGQSQVFVADSDGSNIRQLSDQFAGMAFPVWSPDGNSIAVEAKIEGKSQILVIGLNDNIVRQLTYDFDDCYTPAWSPDSQLIAFQGRVGGKDHIYLVEANGSDPWSLTNNRFFNYFPVWSSDGSYIAYLAGKNGFELDVYVMEADGSNPLLIASETSYSSWPSWQP